MKIARMQLAENGPSILTESIKSLKDSMLKKDAKGVTTLDGLNDLINSMKNKK